MGDFKKTLNNEATEVRGLIERDAVRAGCRCLAEMLAGNGWLAPGAAQLKTSGGASSWLLKWASASAVEGCRVSVQGV